MLHLLDMGHTELTIHAFRSSFRDWAAECTEFPNEVLENGARACVADATAAAYRCGRLFEKRRALMRAWADYIMPSEVPANVLTFERKAG
jgi:hypothetical protein